MVDRDWLFVGPPPPQSWLARKLRYLAERLYGWSRRCDPDMGWYRPR